MSKQEGLAISWLHCNDCHRAFENHNRVETCPDGRLQVTKSDLSFSFTSCGHFFCQNCIEQASNGQQFVCKVCGEASTRYKVEGRVAKNLEQYIKPPVSMLEDAMGVMLFQLNNANQLIKSLRAKVSQQKELLTKAKQELTGYKALKETVAQLTAENKQLKGKIANFITDSQDIKATGGDEEIKTTAVHVRQAIPPPPSPSIPNIKINGRLSLKSPILGTPPTFKRIDYGHRPVEATIYGYPNTPSSEAWVNRAPSSASVVPFRGYPEAPPIPAYHHQHTPTRGNGYPMVPMPMVSNPGMYHHSGYNQQETPQPPPPNPPMVGRYGSPRAYPRSRNY